MIETYNILTRIKLPSQEKLKTFDLDAAYGPSVGLTRIARWNRAADFQLNPPKEVLELLQSLKEGHPALYSHSAQRLWWM
jgi:DNA polymerase delta subunit 4